MCKDPQMPMTLAIADCQMDLHVISFTGLDALNDVYRFNIDLVGTQASLDTASLIGRSAFLSFGLAGQGVHGLIHHALEVYVGSRLTHYRLVLMPALQNLAGQPRRCAYHDMSAPQLIAHLLERDGLPTASYRFDQMTGLYPRRPLCIQYDETDLHLLQRLCEEEGIHFRFEQAPDSHTLVFSDDPASFTEHRLPTRFRRDPHDRSTALVHLAECRSIHSGQQDPFWQATHSTPSSGSKARTEREAQALRESLEASSSQRPTDLATAHRQQRSVRHLERLRCERRDFQGTSDQPGLRSGEIMHVLDHPEPLLNDQWLLIEVRHAGRQLQTLEGVDPNDIAAIISALPETENDPLPDDSVSAAGYTNRFKVLPWAMPFRPALRHPRPRINQLQEATLMPQELIVDAQDSLPGHRPIRFDWQKASGLENEPEQWPLAQVMCAAANPVARLQAGTRVIVAHLNSDPDRPVICGVPRALPANRPRIRLEGIDVKSPVYVHLRSGQHLHIESDKVINVKGAQTELHLTPEMISVRGNTTLDTFAPDAPPRKTLTISDLRLTKLPGLRGAPLAARIWYIVRMRKPGLHHLARLAPRHFLFEGTTDDLGYLGLSKADRQQLIREYHKTPQELWLIHPGECMALHTYFQQNWTQQQRDALNISSP